METAALYTLAARHRARALTILTVSDHLRTGERTSAEDRQQTFAEMVEVALAAAVARTDGAGRVAPGESAPAVTPDHG